MRAPCGGCFEGGLDGLGTAGQGPGQLVAGQLVEPCLSLAEVVVAKGGGGLGERVGLFRPAARGDTMQRLNHG